MSQTKTAGTAIDAIHRFWYAKSKFDKEAEKTRITGVGIDYMIFVDYLYHLGIRADKLNDLQIFYRIKNNKILEEMEHSEIASIIYRKIENLDETLPAFNLYGESITGQEIPSRWIKEKILAGISFYFNKSKLLACLYNKEKIQINQDTASEKFIYFKNGYLYATAKKIEFLPYSKLNRYIWSSEIIDHVYTHNKNFNFVCNAQKFIFNIAGQDQIRYNQLLEIAGYLGHSYTGGKLKAVLLTDSTLSNTGEPNGRSGKTLISRLIGGLYTKNPTKRGNKVYVEINGKSFDHTSQFRYQAASHNTKYLVINDTKPGFKIDPMFNDITDGTEVERKGADPFYIQAKMAILANLSIDINGDSRADRICMFELSNYYSSNFGPDQEFKQFFFTDWTDNEYNDYYHYMAMVVQKWIIAGKLPQVKSINYDLRFLAEHTNENFIDYIEEHIQPDIWYGKSEILEKVQNINNLNKLSSKKFASWLKNYNNLSGKFEQWNPATNEQRPAGGNREFKFILKI